MVARAWSALLVLMAALAGPAAAERAPFVEVDPAEARLGWLLFYDPILSGNRNIACATCHHPRFATSDGMALGLGEGGQGLGPKRHLDPANTPEQRVPRNSPALFNLGAREFQVMFHDGRVEAAADQPFGVRTPLGEEMVAGFRNVLAAQAMFPVLSPVEMAGQYNENDVSTAVREGRIAGPGGAWELIAGRVAAIEAYRQAFAALNPEIAAGRAIAYPDIGNALSAFMAFEWRADDSPFDRHLGGEAPLTGAAARGLELFQGAAGCATCHSGTFQTDHGFHAMGAPQLGPGKAERFERHARDEGRFRVTGRAEDLYRFRTPSLRNVARTGPWGHAGSHSELRAFVADHIRSAAALRDYDRRQAILPELPGALDWRALDDVREVEAIAAVANPPGAALASDELDAIMAFLEALTDEASIAGRLGIPDSVPSGLTVER